MPVESGIFSPGTDSVPGADGSSGLQIVCFEDQKFRDSRGCEEVFFPKRTHDWPTNGRKDPQGPSKAGTSSLNA